MDVYPEMQQLFTFQMNSSGRKEEGKWEEK
jgi:hypothetical protein